MNRTTEYRPHAVHREKRADGAILLRSKIALGPVTRRTGDWLNRWAVEAPNRVFLAERSGAGWRTVRYGEALQRVRALAGGLLARGLTGKTPILILSGNGVDHGLLALAAQYAGIPTVPVAEQYALIRGAHGRLRHAVDLVRPAMAYAADAALYGDALALDCFAGVEIVASRPCGSPGVTAFSDLARGDNGVDVDAAFDAVTPDTVAKILMTSGSTSSPKGVLTTQGMMCVNQTQLADALPVLHARPPRLVDWLPWNHVFGGSHNFNLALAAGGSLYIDDGRPVPGLFERSLENLSMVTGSLSFNVPVGYGMLLKALAADDRLRRRFFADLDLVFYAGASLPQQVWRGLEAMARETKGEVPLFTTAWGLTETAPSVMVQHEPIGRSGVVGVPLPGCTVKLVPDADGRCEVRVKGPNVMPGYAGRPEQTAEAFDDEGYLITGDAMVFVDPDDPNKGMAFDGRISEDFKLSTGTWVRAAQLRDDLLACLAPLAVDLVITGADRDQIGVMVFPNLGWLKDEGVPATSRDGALTDTALLGEIWRRLAERTPQIGGASTRVSRAIVLAEPPSMPEGEMTAKGNLNFRKVLTRRANLLARLYADDDPDVIKI